MQIWAQKEHVISPFEAPNVSIHRFILETWKGFFWLCFFLSARHPVSIYNTCFVCVVPVRLVHRYSRLSHLHCAFYFVFYMHYYFFSHGICFESDLSLTASALLLLRVFSPCLCRAGVCVCNLPFLFYNLKSSYVALIWSTDISSLKIQFNSPLKMS